MSTQKILLEEKGDIGTLTLNRPDRGNAVDKEMMGAMEGILSELSVKGHLRVLVLCGRGEDFCAGRESWPKPTKSAEDWGEELGQIVRVNHLLTTFPGITIALVQGKANGFGFGLAVLSDLTLSAENSRFSFSEIKAGFPPTIVMSYLSRWIS
ncbi:MAG: enoyl-CoA hydratase/isomerase family protein, partial [Deltaproteobacteria bacterium]|nr:enoyl-CoA hydratase/isomerase family protein [Deltaproteobacteria bacterium]